MYHGTGEKYLESILEKGFDCEIISGIPIFCSASACAKTSLANGNEQIRIYGDSSELDHSLYLPGTKVFLKIGKNIPRLKAASISKKVVIVEDCGLPSEHTYENMEDIFVHYSTILSEGFAFGTSSIIGTFTTLLSLTY